MDSSFRKNAILVVSGIIALVVLTVVLLNLDFMTRKQEVVEDAADLGTVSDYVPVEEDGRVVGANLDAFLTRDTFFDPDTGGDSYTASLAGLETLSLKVYSLFRDIRIRIVDEEDMLVKGKEFTILLEGQDTYTDLDRDGIVVITGLDAGRYYVTLQEAEGYRTNASFVYVEVKDSLSFEPIEDIDYLLHHESTILTFQEDGKVYAASDEVYEPPVDDPNLYRGVDVSSNSGDVRWEDLAQEGNTFALIRCGYRGASTGILVEDEAYERNIQGALATGMDVGVVFVSQAVTEAEAMEEASVVVHLIKGYDVTYPVFVDTSSAGGLGRADGLTQRERTNIARTFCKTIQNAGYSAGVYASADLTQDWIYLEELDSYVIWIADYHKEVEYEGNYQLWQYQPEDVVEPGNYYVNRNIGYLGY